MRFPITSSARSVSSRIGRVPLCIAMLMIGRSFGSNRMITGSSMSRGSCRRMRATFPCTSGCIFITSTPRWNCRRTIDEPSVDVEVISFSPSVVLSASSIGLETSRSTTSGEAPG